MAKFISSVFLFALGLAATGQLKNATLEMARLAAKAQHHQISYLKFSRMLTRCDLGTLEHGTPACVHERPKVP